MASSGPSFSSNASKASVSRDFLFFIEKAVVEIKFHISIIARYVVLLQTNPNLRIASLMSLKKAIAVLNDIESLVKK